MKCPKCQSDSKVLETRYIDHGVRRRRECKKCFHRFRTYETTNIDLYKRGWNDALKRIRNSFNEAIKDDAQMLPRFKED